MKLFNYTKWEIVDIYNAAGAHFVVHVRMNLRTGMKHFKCKQITGKFHISTLITTPDKINQLTKTK